MPTNMEAVGLAPPAPHPLGQLSVAPTVTNTSNATTSTTPFPATSSSSHGNLEGTDDGVAQEVPGEREK